jgi:hypothetical protein
MRGDNVLDDILTCAKSEKIEIAEIALIDLRLLIEVSNYKSLTAKQKLNYTVLLSNEYLIKVQISENDREYISGFLLYILFEFKDRSVLAAKCLKVLDVDKIKSAICAGIMYYLHIDDHTACELIMALTDSLDLQQIKFNSEIMDVFAKVIKDGGEYSKEAVNMVLSLANDE